MDGDGVRQRSPCGEGHSLTLTTPSDPHPHQTNDPALSSEGRGPAASSIVDGPERRTRRVHATPRPQRYH